MCGNGCEEKDYFINIADWGRKEVTGYYPDCSEKRSYASETIN